MAAKKADDGGKPMSKTAFILGQPRELSADGVVAKASEQGISLTNAHVYAVRSKAGLTKRSGRKGKRRGRPARTATSAESVMTAPPASRVRAGGQSLESQFTSLVAEIGLARAEELLRTVRAKFTSAARG